MTRLELFALSAFIDLLAESDDHEHNAESARLDHIFGEECRLAGLNAIEVSHQADSHFKLAAALLAVGFVSQWNPRKTTACSIGEAVRCRAPARIGEGV